MELNEHTDLSTLAGQLKKKVNGLLGVYFLLILLTIVLYVLIVAAVGFLGYAMITGGRIRGRVLVLLFAVIVAATAALVAVLRPIFKIFAPSKRRGTEVHRADHPELFALIDGVVKDVDCPQPMHVYVNNECNASVGFRSIFGYLKKKGRQNLNIGLPLLYAMNRTEMKAILAHEFGHFTQKSVQMNQVANLSEFICGSILYSQDALENADSDSYTRYARGYVRFIGKVMMKQYDKVAPLNGILSRAQEFDADHYAQRVAGTEGSVSALSKMSHIATRWSNYCQILSGYEQEEKRAPESVLDSLWAFTRVSENLGMDKLAPEVRFTEPIDEFPSRIGEATDTDTHPSTAERVATLKTYPVIRTLWDDRPALGMFDPALTQKTFNSVRDDIQKAVFPETTVFLKNDITPDVIMEHYSDAVPPRYNAFYQDPVFFSEESVPDGAEASDPFTEENGRLAMEYHTAREDLDALLAIREENDPEDKFRYLGKPYDGTCAPVELHQAYFDPLHARMAQVAKRCNGWLEKGVAEKGKDDVYQLFRHCAEAQIALKRKYRTLRVAAYIVQNDIQAPEAQAILTKSIDAFHAIIEPFMVPDAGGERAIDRLQAYVEMKDETLKALTAFHENKASVSSRRIIDISAIFAAATQEAREKTWRDLVLEVLLAGE